MNNQTMYEALEANMLRYQDLVDVPVRDNGEPLVALQETPFLVARQLREEMLPLTGERIYVRRSLARMLGKASLNLKGLVLGGQLQVGYGYRALSIQRKNFEKVKASLSASVPAMMLDEAAHRYVASPSVAGHPTGGAVDVRIVRAGTPIDCGTAMWDFVPDSYAFSQSISNEALDNRMILRAVMKGAGFAPFNGEWWHFSYGDKEWARYYGKQNALYEQVEFSLETEPKI